MSGWSSGDVTTVVKMKPVIIILYIYYCLYDMSTVKIKNQWSFSRKTFLHTLVAIATVLSLSTLCYFLEYDWLQVITGWTADILRWYRQFSLDNGLCMCWIKLLTWRIASLRSPVLYAAWPCPVSCMPERLTWDSDSEACIISFISLYHVRDKKCHRKFMWPNRLNELKKD